MIQNDEEFTTQEKEVIEKFKKRTMHMLKTPRLLNDQTLFYRFLKARDFNMEHAEDMFKKHIADRKKFEIDDVAINYKKKAPEHVYEYGPLSFVGFDKEGCVILYLDIGKCDWKGVNTIYNFKQIVQYIAHGLENGIDRLTEQSIKLGKSLTKYTIIVNMDKLSLFQITYKKAVERLYAGFKFYQDNYPERSKIIIIINASSVFNIWRPIVQTFFADSLLQKFQIYGKTGWQRVLLELIDADVLPAFLGGNRTDPDGNPLCNSFIIHGKKVPEELYPTENKKSLCKRKDAKKVTISRFSSFEMEFYVNEPKTQIEWEFETKSRDIAFALNFKENAKNTSEIVHLIPKQRIETLANSETGYYICNETGTYILVFDNSYSWFHSKELYYRIRLIRPHEQTTEIK